MKGDLLQLKKLPLQIPYSVMSLLYLRNSVQYLEKTTLMRFLMNFPMISNDHVICNSNLASPLLLNRIFENLLTSPSLY